MYSREIRHDGLNKFRVIRGKSLYEVDQKAEMQLRVWEDQWNRVVKRHEEAQLKSNKRATAQQLSDQLKKERQLAEEYLILTIKRNKTVDLRRDLQRRTFDAEEPIAPELESIRQMPDPKAKVYQPIYNIIEQILPFLATNKKEEAKKRYDREHRIWMNEKEEIESRNEGKSNEYQSNYLKWKNDKESFEKNEKERLEFLESVFDNYRTQKEGSIEGYFDYLLNRFTLLDYIPIQRNMKYLIDTKTLYIEQYLPSIEELPSTKEIKYVVEGDEFVEIPLSNKFLNEFYDRLIYSLILSYLHLIFSNDKRNKIDSIAFNGYVDTINKGTGNSETPCIASIFVSREEFESINLEFVNPKTCFKQLKGVGSSKLHTLTSVPPVIKMDWDDDRIIDGKETLSQMDDTTNLAAMDWQDFEHLIREVFEREFSKNGGEVKITQASRDGGVDAIAFDPDPLRGGKIVIQAKRYTNTVGVAAVRDLYGTVMNEGAIKGILVSTADYGPDAYNFAKDKPLTLLNGSNLLYLLENHGHKAVIDLKAAKEGRRLNE
ncbi:restriction endonuclease [Exiguobacterium profundum]|uniref:restriction endonuclease n=1 Tax=Exiguobacterium profundum TaxID=307643 RepID=UPI0028978985|nr:restriction endonuclease [Exiguobacterium profundum]